MSKDETPTDETEQEPVDGVDAFGPMGEGEEVEEDEEEEEEDAPAPRRSRSETPQQRITDAADQALGPGRFYAHLDSITVKRSSGGRVLETKWQCRKSHFGELTNENTAYIVVFGKLMLGEGGTIEGIGTVKDPGNGERTLKFTILFPQNQIHNIGQTHLQLVDTAEVLELEAMQQALPLPDGTLVDLTARAE
jgi:hypothetical protein